MIFVVRDTHPGIYTDIGFIKAGNLSEAEVIAEVVIKDCAPWDRITGSVEKYMQFFIEIKPLKVADDEFEKIFDRDLRLNLIAENIIVRGDCHAFPGKVGSGR